MPLKNYTRWSEYCFPSCWQLHAFPHLASALIFLLTVPQMCSCLILQTDTGILQFPAEVSHGNQVAWFSYRHWTDTGCIRKKRMGVLSVQWVRRFWLLKFRKIRPALAYALRPPRITMRSVLFIIEVNMDSLRAWREWNKENSERLMTQMSKMRTKDDFICHRQHADSLKKKRKRFRNASMIRVKIWNQSRKCDCFFHHRKYSPGRLSSTFPAHTVLAFSGYTTTKQTWAGPLRHESVHPLQWFFFYSVWRLEYETGRLSILSSGISGR